MQWLWLAYWEFIYFACILSVAIIWRPNENNVHYAYSTQLPQDAQSAGQERDDDDMVKLEEMEGSKEKEEGEEEDDDDTKYSDEVSLDDSSSAKSLW